MKKLLISILMILLVALIYCLMFQNISIGTWKSKSFKSLKDSNDYLNNRINIATETKNLNYPKAVEDLETSVKKFKKTKDSYETKTTNISENVELGVVQIKQYKIERLWITLENYAKDRNVELILDLVESNASAVEQMGATLYDLNITVLGDYINITDFISDVEKDDTLDFKILNFKLTPNVLASVEVEDTDKTDDAENSEEKKQTTTYRVEDGLKATFRVEGVGIELK